MAKYTPFRPLAKISSAHMNPLYIVKRRGVFEVTPATVVGVSEQLIRSLWSCKIHFSYFRVTKYYQSEKELQIKKLTTDGAV